MSRRSLTKMLRARRRRNEDGNRRCWPKSSTDRWRFGPNRENEEAGRRFSPPTGFILRFAQNHCSDKEQGPLWPSCTIRDSLRDKAPRTGPIWLFRAKRRSLLLPRSGVVFARSTSTHHLPTRRAVRGQDQSGRGCCAGSVDRYAARPQVNYGHGGSIPRSRLSPGEDCALFGRD